MANLVVARRGAARTSAEDAPKDFFWASTASVSSIALIRALQEKWIPRDHQSLASFAASILAMYAINKTTSLLGQGSREAWKQCVDLTNKRITLKDTAGALVCGAIVAYYMSGFLPPTVSLGTGAVTGLISAYASST